MEQQLAAQMMWARIRKDDGSISQTASCAAKLGSIPEKWRDEYYEARVMVVEIPHSRKPAE